MAVQVYGGRKEWPGIDRAGGSFLDGDRQRHCFYSEGDLVVTDVNDKEIVRFRDVFAADFPGVTIAIRQIECVRSAQNGALVVHCAGFFSGQGGQRFWSVNTGWPIADPVVYRTPEGG